MGVYLLMSPSDMYKSPKEYQTDPVSIARLSLFTRQPPMSAAYVNFTVTTERAGSETVTAPPESVAPVDATECELSVSQAEAAEGLNPLIETLADWAEPPEFVKTTTTDPSVFLKAPIATLEMVPEVPTRTAPGRMNRDHMASAQRRPEGIAFAPSRTALGGRVY